MESHVEENLWGALVSRGIIAILFGTAAVFWPGITLVTLVYLFSAFILTNGLIGLISGLVSSGDSFTSRMLTVIVSVVELGVGVYLLRHPLVSFATLILLIGFTLILHGVFDVVGGLFSRGSATQKLFTILSGALAGLAGVIILFQPAASGVAFVWILGLYSLLTGPMLIAMALDMKNATAVTAKPSRSSRA